MDTFLRNIYHRLGSWVLPNKGGGVEALRNAALLVFVLMASAVFLLLFGLLYFFIGYYQGVYACLYGIGIAVFLLVLFRYTGNIRLTTWLFDINALALFIILCLGSGGIQSPILPWLTIIPISAFVFGGAERGLLMSGICLVAILVFAILHWTGYLFPDKYDVQYTPLLTTFVGVGLLAYISMVVLLYEVSKGRRILELDRLNLALEEGRRIIEENQHVLQLRNEEVIRVNEHLENLVRERTAHLHLAKSELDTFLHEASHALRRPLARIMGLVQIVRTHPDPKVADEMESHIDTTASRMDDMLRKLTLVSEINANEVKTERVNANLALRNAISAWEQLPGADKSMLELDIPEDLEFIGDKGLFATCALMLLENALMFSKPGSRPRIHLSCRKEHGKISLVVYDEGIGIPPQSLTQVCGMFYRATADSHGSGLGLYVARKAVDRMKGEIIFRSKLGVWTEAELQLPV